VGYHTLLYLFVYVSNKGTAKVTSTETIILKILLLISFCESDNNKSFNYQVALPILQLQSTQRVVTSTKIGQKKLLYHKIQRIARVWSNSKCIFHGFTTCRMRPAASSQNVSVLVQKYLSWIGNTSATVACYSYAAVIRQIILRSVLHEKGLIELLKQVQTPFTA